MCVKVYANFRARAGDCVIYIARFPRVCVQSASKATFGSLSEVFSFESLFVAAMYVRVQMAIVRVRVIGWLYLDVSD